MIAFGRDVCGDFSNTVNREWLETNGIGGYASSTISGANTRRYHGLLVAATRPPVGRVVLLSKFEETLILGDERYDLSCNQYPGKVHPEGYRFLTRFRLDPFPVWTYAVAGIEIEKTVFMVHGENTTVCQWTIKLAVDARLELRPLVAFRDHHHLRHTREIDLSPEVSPGMVSLRSRADLPDLFFSHNADAVEATGHWYRNFEYPIERERGFDHHEDLFQPFVLSFDLANSAVVVASTSAWRRSLDATGLAADEKARRRKLTEISGATDVFSQHLVLAADQFIVSRGKGKTIIAGYHWFSDWGRDTMIALRGLTLSTKGFDVARDILLEFSRHISEGMLPNRFPDTGGADYNTVDATLWYFEAIRAYLDATGDATLIRDLYPRLVEIIDWHIRGTRFGIHVDEDGLLYAGEPGVQLTWMDAKIGDNVITPRTGKAVEVQALWYNALCVIADITERIGDDPRRFVEMSSLVKKSFNAQFWNGSQACLFDVVDGDAKDGSIRPNQIFAVSLPHTMLSQRRARAVVKKVEVELLTPFGLRSLSPSDPRYVGTYIGSAEARDSAYHQGTVWAWLIGPFVDAFRRVHAQNGSTERRIREIVSGFERHLTEAAIGQISEIFDGDPPHRPRGAVAQAWSVAELLRVTCDLSRVPPTE